MAASRTLLPLLAMIACCSADAASRTADSPAGEQDLLAKMLRHPMIFFVAKGGPNACGSHCSEWIAAEGNIDTEAAKRFREFLDEPAIVLDVTAFLMLIREAPYILGGPVILLWASRLQRAVRTIAEAHDVCADQAQSP